MKLLDYLKKLLGIVSPSAKVYENYKEILEEAARMEQERTTKYNVEKVFKPVAPPRMAFVVWNSSGQCVGYAEEALISIFYSLGYAPITFYGGDLLHPDQTMVARDAFKNAQDRIEEGVPTGTYDIVAFVGFDIMSLADTPALFSLVEWCYENGYAVMFLKDGAEVI